MLFRSALRASRGASFAFAAPVAAASSVRFASSNPFVVQQATSKAFAAIALTTVGAGCAAISLAEPKTDIKMVKEAIAELIDDTNCGPLLVRLAWHAAGTYDKETKTGGSNGATMRFPPESGHGANAGLHLARNLLDPIKAKFPGISYADLWTLAGCVAIETMGGPAVNWRAGRTDAESGTACPPDGRLPDADGRDTTPAQHVRDIFYRQGFNDQEIVALLGAHALGRCHPDRSGFDGPWTYAETTFSNEFFRLLLEDTWTPKKWGGPMQFENRAKDLMMLPTDMCLISDPEFRKSVEKYAKDEEAFFKDFACAFKKLMENGVGFPKSGWRAWLPW